jgi:hypothetical protein
MESLLSLLLILITLYTNQCGIDDPRYIQKIMKDVQTIGIEATIEDIEKTLEQNGISISDDGTITYIEHPSAESGLTDETGNVPNESVDEGSSSRDGEAPAVNNENVKTDNQDKKLLPENIDYKKELVKLGYYRKDSNDATLNLRNAVLRFQSDCNLIVDGIWGKKSMNALLLRLNSTNRPCNDVIQTPPTKGQWIVINKTKRILTLYENKTIIAKYPISVGNPVSLTPDGKFKIVSKVVNPAWGGGGYAKSVKGGVPENPLGYRWMGLSYKNGNEIGIHGNNSPYSIGKNISHGCIRMINSDVELLFEKVKNSTPVWIGTDDILKDWSIVQNEPSVSP